MSDFDKTHIGEIINGHGDWFTARLLRLIASADVENLARLQLGFPEEVGAFLDWRERTS